MPALLRASLAVVLLLGLLALPVAAEDGSESASDAGDEVEYEDVTLYFHGTELFGEVDAASLAHMRMSDEEPQGSEPKSMFVTNAVATPNRACSGSPLLPTWDGFIEGEIQGEVRVHLQTLAHPAASVNVQLFKDAGELACNEAYVPPFAEQIVELEPGLVDTEVVFEDVDVEVFDTLTIMVSYVDANQVRVFYDAADALSRVEFRCLPREEGGTCIW